VSKSTKHGGGGTDGTGPPAGPPSGLLRVQGTSKLAFGATTAALVTLASGGTAVLVAHGTSRMSSPTALPQGALSPDQGTFPATVVVERVGGTFGAQPSATLDPSEQAIRDALGERPAPGRRTLTVPLVLVGGSGDLPVPALGLPDLPGVPGLPRPPVLPPGNLPPGNLPPVAKPPVDVPPVAKPPVAIPPVVKPPVDVPPVAKPPVAIPPVVKPPPVHAPRVPLPTKPTPTPATPVGGGTGQSGADDRDDSKPRTRGGDRDDDKGDRVQHATAGKGTGAATHDRRARDKADVRRGDDRDSRGKHAKRGRHSH
jgi:hypothetical protein